MIEAKQNDLLCLAWQAFEGERKEGMTHVNMKDREIKRNTSKDAIIFVIPHLINPQKSNKNIRVFCRKIIAHRLPLIFSCALK